MNWQGPGYRFRTIAPLPMENAWGFVGGICGAALLGLAIGVAPSGRASAAEAAPAPDAPSTVGFACLSNACGQTSAQRDAAKVAAAIKAGDGRAVMTAGGGAGDLLAAWMTQMDGADGYATEPGGVLKPLSGQSVRDQIAPGSEQLVSLDGRLGVVYDLVGGGHQTLSFPDAAGFIAAPDGARADSPPTGAVAISRALPNTTTARQVLGYYTPPPN
ncbi:MAG: hypothetical protein JWM33_990 [Caulobacteraceae bacterium]|nr:hypothetical protein [Caulobacteraceae bacterium]